MDCAENRIDETTDWIILRAWRVACIRMCTNTVIIWTITMMITSVRSIVAYCGNWGSSEIYGSLVGSVDDGLCFQRQLKISAKFHANS